MDRKEYGEYIVNKIIEDYKRSDEFKKDAQDYVKSSIIIQLNWQEGDAANVLSGSKMTQEDQDRFMINMQHYKGMRETLEALYSLTFKKEQDGE